MAFLAPIAGAVGGRLGAFLAGKVGQAAATRAMGAMASRPVTTALDWGMKQGGTVGKVATGAENALVKYSPDIQMGAAKLGEAAAPYLGAKLGYDMGKQFSGRKSDSSINYYGGIY